MKMKLYFKTLYISSVLIFCLLFGFIGIAKAYENIRLVGFGEYRSAIEIEDGKLKIFDMEIVLD
jgi:hypothetical protein